MLLRQLPRTPHSPRERDWCRESAPESPGAARSLLRASRAPRRSPDRRPRTRARRPDTSPCQPLPHSQKTRVGGRVRVVTSSKTANTLSGTLGTKRGAWWSSLSAKTLPAATTGLDESRHCPRHAPLVLPWLLLQSPSTIMSKMMHYTYSHDEPVAGVTV